MPISQSIEDTAAFDFGREPPEQDHRVSLEDTARLRLDAPHNGRAHEAIDGRPHPYAAGIIRFYRARTVLTREADSAYVSRERALRAWAYLEPVQLKELPPPVRHSYLNLTYLVLHELALPFSENADTARFACKVLEIAAIIDDVIDELLADA